jgi:hypothetical protein
MDDLAPIGIGTPDGESLSSYVQRLSQEHGTFPGQLVFRLLAWLDKNAPDEIGKWARSSGHLRLGFNNNSFSHADAWLNALQRYSGRADLGDLTTRTWDNLFPTRGFQDETLKWCPMCLAEDRVPYYRLAWSLQSATVCCRHHVQLQRRCAHCGRALPVLHDRSLLTQCAWCAGDLRLPDTPRDTVAESTFEYWCAREVGAIVQRSTEWHRTIGWNAQGAMQLLAHLLPRPTAAALGRRIGTSKLTTWYWLTGRASPTLSNVLRAYHSFDVSLSEHMFSSDVSRLPINSSKCCQHVLYLRPIRFPHTRAWNAIRSRLEAALQCPLEEAPSFIAVSTALGVARRTLRAHEPVLCRALSGRYRQRQIFAAQAREETLCAEFASALARLSESHVNPKWRTIEAALKRPGLLNSRYARDALKRATRSLSCGQ